ncbi:MAG: hypothetical protein FWB95_03860 [Treponema sp.]|nr:hypothetical protein [Treponema sp.]
MKKLFVFLASAVFIFGFSTCDIPKAIEVTGNPGFSLAGRYDIGETLNDMVSGLFDDMKENESVKIFDCVNVKDVYTTLIYINVDELDFEFTNRTAIEAAMGSNNELEITNGVFNVSEFPKFDYPAEIPGEETFDMPDFDLSEYIHDFRFTGYKAALYIYGHNILDCFSIKIGGEEKGKSSAPDGFANFLATNSDDYPGTVIPFGGHDITDSLPIGTSSNTLSVKIAYKDDPTVKVRRDMLDPGKIKIELIIWLPLKMEATAAGDFEFDDLGSGGKVISGFTDNDEDDLCDVCGLDYENCSCPTTPVEADDLLGRSSAGGLLDGMLDITSLNLKITFGASLPFTKSKIVISDAENTYFDIPLNSNSISLDFPEEKMKKVLDTYPFAPAFDIHYENGATLALPRKLEITRLDLTVGVKARVEFGQ